MELELLRDNVVISVGLLLKHTPLLIKKNKIRSLGLMYVHVNVIQTSSTKWFILLNLTTSMWKGRSKPELNCGQQTVLLARKDVWIEPPNLVNFGKENKSTKSDGSEAHRQ